jgi:hypothetical protein
MHLPGGCRLKPIGDRRFDGSSEDWLPVARNALEKCLCLPVVMTSSFQFSKVLDDVPAPATPPEPCITFVLPTGNAAPAREIVQTYGPTKPGHCLRLYPHTQSVFVSTAIFGEGSAKHHAVTVATTPTPPARYHSICIGRQ